MNDRVAILEALIPPDFIPKRAAPDAIANVLRDAISFGHIPAGQPLRQIELAEHLGVSRIPLREALRQLESEGLISYSPNRGAVVTNLSWEEARQLGEMRIALETLALGRAVPALDPANIDRAADVLTATERERDNTRWSELNWSFHRCLYEGANRPMLLAAIERLHRNVNRYMSLVLADLGHQHASHKEHRLILEACRQGDSARACSELEHHIAAANVRLISYLRGEAAPRGRSYFEIEGRRQA